jgi:hypothetical protein
MQQRLAHAEQRALLVPRHLGRIELVLSRRHLPYRIRRLGIAPLCESVPVQLGGVSQLVAYCVVPRVEPFICCAHLADIALRELEVGCESTSDGLVAPPVGALGGLMMCERGAESVGGAVEDVEEAGTGELGDGGEAELEEDGDDGEEQAGEE